MRLNILVGLSLFAVNFSNVAQARCAQVRALISGRDQHRTGKTGMCTKTSAQA